MHSWSTFGAQMNHGQTKIHKIHHSPYLGEATTFPLIIFFVLGHKANTQMSFCPETPPSLEAHDFVWTLLIEVEIKAKL
jgi:hypothetical protein